MKTEKRTFTEWLDYLRPNPTFKQMNDDFGSHSPAVLTLPVPGCNCPICQMARNKISKI